MSSVLLPQAAPGPVAEPLTSWAQSLRLAWRVFLPVRLLLWVVGGAVQLARLGPPAEPGVGAWLDWLIVRPWAHSDVIWYVSIAQFGYGIADGRGAFHPLLPALMGGLGRLLGGQFALAGQLVASAACLVLLAALYRYVALDHGERVAAEAIRWALLAPTGFVLLIPYTESLLLACTLLALWYARHDRWLLAGLFACAAALTKQPGAALVLPLIWEYASRHRAKLWGPHTLRALVGVGLVPLGYLAFSVYRGLAVGELDTSSPAALLGSLALSDQLSGRWKTGFGMPWEWLAHVVATLPEGDWFAWLDLALTAPMLAGIALALRRERGTVVVYSLSQVFLMMTLLIIVQPLLSMPRRLALIFPLYTQLARWSLRSSLRLAWMGISAACMLALTVSFCRGVFIP